MIILNKLKTDLELIYLPVEEAHAIGVLTAAGALLLVPSVHTGDRKTGMFSETLD